jgi:mitochondrial fission protein ELM1
LLTGHKAGDNNQVQALAEALHWPFKTKRFRYRPWELLSNRLLGITLAGINRAASSPLGPPWPELVITAGRRNEPVARWIRKQSGGRTRLVHLGRPWAPLESFDLIVVTPQYFLPDRDNILHVDLPLHRITRAGLDAVAREWAARFTDLPRPWWSVLLGGDSGPFVFTTDKAVRLADWLNTVVGREGGAVLVTNSARTPAAAYAAFLETLTVPVSAWHWGESAGKNPYQAYLALAGRLVVTGESMSMLAEASIAGVPLYLFDLSDCAHDLAGRCRPSWLLRRNYRFKPLSHRLAMQLAPRRMRRDVARIQQRLIASGRAVWAGEEWDADHSAAAPDEIDVVVERVRALFSQDTSS